MEYKSHEAKADAAVAKLKAAPKKSLLQKAKAEAKKATASSVTSAVANATNATNATKSSSDPDFRPEPGSKGCICKKTSVNFKPVDHTQGMPTSMVKTYMEVTKPTRKVVAAVIKPKTPMSVKDAKAYAQKLKSPEQREKDAAANKKDRKATEFDDKIVSKKNALKKAAKEKA